MKWKQLIVEDDHLNAEAASDYFSSKGWEVETKADGKRAVECVYIRKERYLKMGYVTGRTIKELREKRKITQKELSEKIGVSDKTVSKWETGKGLPDIGIIEELARALGVSIAELLTGDLRENGNQSANMRKMCFYVCPVCGNIISQQLIYP